MKNDIEISIYTDVSKLRIDKRGEGRDFSAKLDTKISIRQLDYCSVFQAEITVINENLLVLRNRLLKTKNIFIYLYTYMQAALKPLKSLI